MRNKREHMNIDYEHVLTENYEAESGWECISQPPAEESQDTANIQPANYIGDGESGHDYAHDLRHFPCE